MAPPQSELGPCALVRVSEFNTTFAPLAMLKIREAELPFSRMPLVRAEASMVIVRLPVSCISPLVIVMVDPDRQGAKLMEDTPLAMACRSEPAPLSAVLVTA